MAWPKNRGQPLFWYTVGLSERAILKHMEKTPSKLSLFILPVVLVMSLILGVRQLIWKKPSLLSSKPLLQDQIRLVTVISTTAAVSEVATSTEVEWPSGNNPNKEDSIIGIQNGSGEKGMGKYLASRLADLGLNVLPPTDALRRFTTTTLVSVLHDNLAAQEVILNEPSMKKLENIVFANDWPSGTTDAVYTSSTYPDVLIILGEDYAP